MLILTPVWAARQKNCAQQRHEFSLRQQITSFAGSATLRDRRRGKPKAACLAIDIPGENRAKVMQLDSAAPTGEGTGLRRRDCHQRR
jgi:hypothetical protein